MNQLDRIMEVTGRPTSEDVDAIKSPFAATMLESLPLGRPRALNEMFPSASLEALDLLRTCLAFNPGKRILAKDALRHPYVVQFHNPEDEFECPNIIQIPIDDNTKLTVQDYRERLYNEVLKKKKEQRRSHRRNLEMQQQQQQQQVVSQQQYSSGQHSHHGQTAPYPQSSSVAGGGHQSSGGGGSGHHHSSSGGGSHGAHRNSYSSTPTGGGSSHGGSMQQYYPAQPGNEYTQIQQQQQQPQYYQASAHPGFQDTYQHKSQHYAQQNGIPAHQQPGMHSAPPAVYKSKK